MKPTILLLILCTMLVGCDTARGIAWQAKLTSRPTPACLEQSLRAVPTLTQVDPLPTDAGVIRYNYQSPRTAGMLTLTPTTPPTLSINTWWLNQVPTREQVTDARAAFAEIMKSLRANCSGVPDDAAVRERVYEIPREDVPERE